jgi:hypothetical protein
MYIGTLGIYVQSFMDESTTTWENKANEQITLISDFIFSLDIALNFVTAYHRKDFRLETRFKFIAMNYLFGGFFLVDMVSAIPFELIITSDTEFTTVRMIKLLRLFKLLKLSKYNDRFKSLFSQTIDIRLVITLIILFLMSHISACLLY